MLSFFSVFCLNFQWGFCFPVPESCGEPAVPQPKQSTSSCTEDTSFSRLLPTMEEVREELLRGEDKLLKVNANRSLTSRTIGCNLVRHSLDIHFLLITSPRSGTTTTFDSFEGTLHGCLVSWPLAVPLWRSTTTAFKVNDATRAIVIGGLISGD